jgi:hypothetical protein
MMPDEPEVSERMNPVQYTWHLLQLFAWALWPKNDCPYCWWYRGVAVGLLLGGIVTWSTLLILKN